jgi:uncharacterized C2H2 Zn-finger protein
MLKCPRCGYETKYRTTILRHTNRKNICSNTLSDIIPNEDNIIKAKTKDHKCDICDKYFSREDSLKRHQIKCQSKAKDDRIKELEQKLAEKIAEPQNVTINVQQNFIMVGKYDDPDTEFLTDKHYKRAFRAKNLANVELAKILWMNPKHPENHSVIIPNISRTDAKVCVGNGNRFVLKDGDEVFTKMLKSSEYYMNDKVNEWEEEDKHENVRTTYLNYMEKREETPKLQRKEKKELRNALIDSRDIIKETHKKVKKHKKLKLKNKKIILDESVV